MLHTKFEGKKFNRKEVERIKNHKQLEKEKNEIAYKIESFHCANNHTKKGTRAVINRLDELFF